MTAKFKPTLKQHELFKTFNTEYLEVLFGGSAGSGKSFILWALMIIKSLEFPGIRIGLARQTLAQIKKNTISTFYEVCKLLKIEEIHYKYNEMKGEITFSNGSQIIFYELRYLPSDPNYDRFGGALLTFGCIEEAAGCDKRGKEVFSSRLGRWLNDQYNIRPQLFMTTNPGTNFVYSDFYIPFSKNELPNHRHYIPAFLKDNQYQSKFYKDALYARLDKANADRLLNGVWNFDDDNTRLNKYNNIHSMYDVLQVDMDDIEDINTLLEGEYYLTADIAFTGDRCIFIIWKGLNIIKIINYTGQDSPEIEIEKLTHKYKIPPRNVAYDSDGVGKYLKTKLKQATDIINNGKSINNENYVNLKSQLQFKLAELINQDKIKIYDNNFKDDAIQELYEMKSIPLESTEGKLAVVKKAEIKKLIGRSPDIADAISFRMVFELKKKVVRPF